jgi:hypothetical protein
LPNTLEEDMTLFGRALFKVMIWQRVIHSCGVKRGLEDTRRMGSSDKGTRVSFTMAAAS